MGINAEQALDCFRSDDLIGLGMEADAVRRGLHPEGVVTYILAPALDCSVLDLNDQAERAVSLGATALTLRQAASVGLPTLLASLHDLHLRYISLALGGVSATDVAALAAAAHLSPSEVLKQLQAAGLATLSGHDAAILADGLPAPHRCSVPDWLCIHRTAHQLGLPTTALLVFGGGETLAQRVEHLTRLRTLQEETGGFLSLLPTAAPNPRELDGPTAVEYLKTLAISRLFLDAIPHLEADWPAQGLKVLQMALRFGADDAGSIFPNQVYPQAADATEEDLRRIIRGAGLLAVERDAAFRSCILR